MRIEYWLEIVVRVDGMLERRISKDESCTVDHTHQHRTQGGGGGKGGGRTKGSCSF